MKDTNTKRMLINATHSDELRVAIIQGSRLIDLDIEHPGQDQITNNIYKGVITSIEPSLGAVFVNFGREKHGFLPLKEISREYFLTQNQESIHDADIHKLLKLGQELVVQVDKEERGTKGAALTTLISLAGSYLVLMPNNPRAGGISRRIEGEDRDLLRDTFNQLQIPPDMGLIVRTAGVGKSKDELEWDLSILLHYWEAVKQAAVAKAGPYLIHQESDVIIRAIRDHFRQDIVEVIVDDPTAFARAETYINQVRPNLASRLKQYSDQLPLFSHFQVEQQIESAYDREHRLPSGGSIVIDHTEALVSIDINSARATKGSNIEETAHNTNLEAAEEIARQLRIRDIGGLIVIDFIDMLASRNQRDVENRLREALKPDRARIQIGRISRFGLLEMSRQRLSTPLIKASQVACPRCSGRGTIRGVESLTLSIIHLLQEQAAKTDAQQIQVQLPVDVATYILNEKRHAINSIEQYSNSSILIIPNPHIHSPHYHLKVSRETFGREIASYKLVKIPKAETAADRRPAAAKAATQPAVKEFLTSSTPTRKKTPSGGLIKRLWDKMFSAESKPTAPARPKAEGRTPTTSAESQRRRKPITRQQKNKPASRSPQEQKRTRKQPTQTQTSKPTPQHGKSSAPPRKERTPALEAAYDTENIMPIHEAQPLSTPSPKREASRKATVPAEKKTTAPASSAKKTTEQPSKKPLPEKNNAEQTHSSTPSKKINQTDEFVKAVQKTTPTDQQQQTSDKAQTPGYKGFGHAGNKPLQQVKTNKAETPKPLDTLAPKPKIKSTDEQVTDEQVAVIDKDKSSND